MFLKSYCVDDPIIIQIYKHIEVLTNEYNKKIVDEAETQGIKITDSVNPAHVLSKLSVDPELVIRYESLLKIKKYLTAMVPSIVKRYLGLFPEIGVEEITHIKDEPAKLEILPELVMNYSKSVIVCSFIPMAEVIQKHLEDLNYNVFIVSRMTYDTGTLINAFRNSPESKTILIISQIGETHLLIPDANLLLFFDTVDTTKLLYQRMKQTTTGEIICLYYTGTNEKEKIIRIFTDIKEKFPKTQIEI